MALKTGSISLDRFRLRNLYNTYLGMTPNEQTVTLVITGAVLLLVVLLPTFAASGRIGKLERSIEESSKQLKNITLEIEHLNEANAELKQVEALLSQGFDASISTTLENLAGKAGIKDRIDSLKEKPAQPSDFFDESSVDVRLKKVTLNELVNYLYSIEQHPERILRLKRLDVKPRYDNKKEFDVSFQVSTYRLLEASGGGE